jgi:hypothetical protein
MGWCMADGYMSKPFATINGSQFRTALSGRLHRIFSFGLVCASQLHQTIVLMPNGLLALYNQTQYLLTSLSKRVSRESISLNSRFLKYCEAPFRATCHGNKAVKRQEPVCRETTRLQTPHCHISTSSCDHCIWLVRRLWSSRTLAHHPLKRILWPKNWRNVSSASSLAGPVEFLQTANKSTLALLQKASDGLVQFAVRASRDKQMAH